MEIKMTYQQFLENLKKYRGKFTVHSSGVIRMKPEYAIKLLESGYPTICCPLLVVLNESTERDYFATWHVWNDEKQLWGKKVVNAADYTDAVDPEIRKDLLRVLELEENRK